MHAALDYAQPRSAWMPRTLARPLFKRLARLALWSLGALGLSWVMPPLLGDTQVVNSISIARPPSEVFDYATTPAHWPSWHPASLEVEGAVEHSLNPAKWVIDGRIEGSRGRGRITYLVAPNQTGTRFEREFRYRMPNLFTAVVDKLITEDRIILESAEALRRLKASLEAQ